MPWHESDLMSLRKEFVSLASAEGANMSALCRRFKIARKTGYKWLKRYQQQGTEGLCKKSRRPQNSPLQTSEKIEQLVLELRQEHPVWGGRKLRARLLALGHKKIPAASTITAILHRHGRIPPAATESRKHYTRFERSEPNELWQIDFKGEFKMSNSQYCYPLTVLDDHSRYAIGLMACVGPRYGVVKEHLITMFRRYGMPRALYADNGTPWASAHSPSKHTRLTAWLMRLGVEVIHGRPYHPQGRGKEERFHRTLKAELLQDRFFDDLCDAQRRFDPFRAMYNQERPHEALSLDVPASRYCVSDREYPEMVKEFDYSNRFEVRKANRVGQFSFKGKQFKTSEAFSGERIGLSCTPNKNVYEVYYCHFRIGWIDVREKYSRVQSGHPDEMN
ncbi:MAG: IS481 family transposase [Planctomycetaceae bacterium]|nr:IS481 family transposase [Planctomycetaceae bacterium]MBL4886616.1 IS481 family transposase [Planctomycetaceae bacterium]